MAQRDASPVYYREIQKHAYLKRMPEDNGGKLRPLVMKKQPLKPMWTQLCIHNGRTPYLEQYKDPVSARAHRPTWRASLVTARHVTASVTRHDSECDFLIDTQEGNVRMLAPNWETMQEWVSTLRTKLRELRIVTGGENEYAAPPARPARPRAAARDPASPLPTPPAPPDRVPGIDLSSIIQIPNPTESDAPETTPESTPTTPEITPETTPEVDISDWDDQSLPSTSQAPTSVANICGQNICLDDSLLKRGKESDDDNDLIDQESDTANVTVIAVTSKDGGTPPDPQSPTSQLIRIGSDTYGSVFEPAYEHLSRACSAVRLQVHDATYEYLYPHNGPREANNVLNEANNVREASGVVREATGLVREATGLVSNVREATGVVNNGPREANNVREASGLVSEAYGVVSEAYSAEANSVTSLPAREASNLASEANNVASDANSDAKKDTRVASDSAKPSWRRGLTELALLGRLHKRGTTNENNNSERVTSRAREARPDPRRRRSSSLSNSGPTPTPALPHCERNEPALQPLRARQAAALVRAQRRGAACVGRIGAGEPPIFADYDNQVWIARWGPSGVSCGGRAGDRVCALAGAAPVSAAHAQRLLATRPIDILFYRVPLAKIFVINKRDQQTLGIALDKESSIQRVLSRSPAALGGIPPAGWAVTEVNNRPLNLIKGADDQMNRISLNGTEASLLLQPSPLVRRLRAALKANR